MQLLRDNLTVRKCRVLIDNEDYIFILISYGRVIHPTHTKPMHQKNISNCLLFFFSFFLSVYNTHTHNRSATKLTKITKKNFSSFFFHLTSLSTYALFFFIFLFVCRCQLFFLLSSLSFFFCVCVCVGCNHYFSLAVCSFSNVRLY